MPTSQVGLRPACTEAIACKICDEATILYGVVDMHRPCLTAGVSHPPLSGHPIYYRRCASCGFLFTDAFDDWTEQDFKTHIYNDGYLAVDPEYVMVRPARHAGLIAKLNADATCGLRQIGCVLVVCRAAQRSRLHFHQASAGADNVQNLSHFRE